MTLGYDEIQYGTQTLLLRDLTRRKIPSTIKQRVGGNIVRHNIPARNEQEWEVSGRGIIYDTATAGTTLRKVLESNDNLTKHHYSDGLITGSFIIEDLVFDDSADRPVHFEYSIKFLEYSQE